MERDYTLYFYSEEDNDMHFVLVSMWDATIYTNIPEEDFTRTGITHPQLKAKWSFHGSKEMEDLSSGELRVFTENLGLERI